MFFYIFLHVAHHTMINNCIVNFSKQGRTCWHTKYKWNTSVFLMTRTPWWYLHFTLDIECPWGHSSWGCKMTKLPFCSNISKLKLSSIDHFLLLSMSCFCHLKYLFWPIVKINITVFFFVYWHRLGKYLHWCIWHQYACPCLIPPLSPLYSGTTKLCNSWICCSNQLC